MGERERHALLASSSTSATPIAGFFVAPDGHDRRLVAVMEPGIFHPRNLTFVQIGANCGSCDAARRRKSPRGDPVSEFAHRHMWQGAVVEPNPATYPWLVGDTETGRVRCSHSMSPGIRSHEWGPVPLPCAMPGYSRLAMSEGCTTNEAAKSRLSSMFGCGNWNRRLCLR